MTNLTAWYKGAISPDDALLEMRCDRDAYGIGPTNEYWRRLKYIEGEAAGLYGRELTSIADTLVETVSAITAKGQDLADAWGGEAAKEAVRELGVLRKAVIELAAAVGTVGEGTRWFGEEVYPAFADTLIGGFEGWADPIWDHESEGNGCDCPLPYANPLAWTGVDSATCIRQEHEYYYEYSDRWVTHPRDALAVANREDFYAGELGRFVNETERQAIEDRRLDPRTAYETAAARQMMDRLNGYFEQLHAFLPEKAVCRFPGDT